jgi:hypothetical protein
VGAVDARHPADPEDLDELVPPRDDVPDPHR